MKKMNLLSLLPLCRLAVVTIIAWHVIMDAVVLATATLPPAHAATADHYDGIHGSSSSSSSRRSDHCHFEEYRLIPRILTPEKSGHRYLMRHWHNAGLGHTLSVVNVALKYALDNNLTYVHNPQNYDICHVPQGYQVDSVLQFGFGLTQRSQVEAAVQAGSVTRIGWPSEDHPVPAFELEGNAARFASFVAQHPQPYTLFEIPTDGALRLFRDQDSRYGQTGGWFQHMYERAAQRRRTSAADTGPPTPAAVRFPRAWRTGHSEVNVAVHVRRGDATWMASRQQRIGSSEMFIGGAIDGVLDIVAPHSPGGGSSSSSGAKAVGGRYEAVTVHVFTQATEKGEYLNVHGNVDDLRNYTKCPQCIVYHFDGDALDTLSHLSRADVLILGQSYFSHFAAVLSRGIKVGHDEPPYYADGLPAFVKTQGHNGQFNKQRFRELWRRYSEYRTCLRSHASHGAALLQDDQQSYPLTQQPPSRDDTATSEDSTLDQAGATVKEEL